MVKIISPTVKIIISDKKKDCENMAIRTMIIVMAEDTKDGKDWAIISPRALTSFV